MRYLDPRADPTFYRVFGEHPDLVISLLNTLLPLDDEHQVKGIEYISYDQVPDTSLKRFNVVNVRCRDALGQHRCTNETIQE